MANNTSADFMIHCLTKFNIFGQDVYLTTTHVSLLIICVGLIALAVVVRFTLKDISTPCRERMFPREAREREQSL